MPLRVKVYVSAIEECRDAAGLCGVTQVRNGWIAESAVEAICGVGSGIEERNGERSEGVD